MLKVKAQNDKLMAMGSSVYQYYMFAFYLTLHGQIKPDQKMDEHRKATNSFEPFKTQIYIINYYWIQPLVWN